MVVEGGEAEGEGGRFRRVPGAGAGEGLEPVCVGTGVVIVGHGCC